ncbi:MAG: hypothetical protein HY876_03105, partial [Coriobacteriales bacterium]|nr:hypothetical protein [Coriobacteriales bacterium]
SQAAKPTATTCGQTGACHTDKVDGSHGAASAHTFSAASDYDRVAEAGCTNSGAGCHGSETTYSSFASYHPNSGCTSGACHTSPSKATYAGDHSCVSCHDSNFVGATDVVGLSDTHYPEPSHSAVGLSTAVSAGGVASATCADCHNPTNLSGVDNLYNQHQGLPAPYADTACGDCHNKNAQVTSVVASKWPSKDCSACHNSVTLPALEQHGTTAPSVNATGTGTYQGLSCEAAGCHGTTDLHVLHKDSAAGCAQTGCHDYSQQAKLPNKKSCGTGGTCHTDAEPHAFGGSHDGSAEPIAQPGTGTTISSGPATAEDQTFATSTWPNDWTRTSTTYVRVQNNAGRNHGTYAAEVYSSNTTRRTYSLYKDIDLSTYTSATLTFWDYAAGLSGGGDYALAEYSTNGGASWTTVSNLSASTAWAQRSASLPVGGIVRVRFTGSVNSTTEFCDWDDINVSGTRTNVTETPLAANSSAAVSCQNNPNATECHDVSDVSALHGSTPGTCDNCHKAGGPTKDCQTSGCHSTQYVNVDDHNSTRHFTNQISIAAGEAFEGTGLTASTCTGCHDDGISNEHRTLGRYLSTPCSMCHKKTTDSGAPTNVTAANTQAALAKATGTSHCTDCHKTVSKSAVHVQRAGDAGTPGTQFADTWSGHRVYDTMPGEKTSFTTAADGVSADRTWSLPTLSSYVVDWDAGRTEASNMTVRCNDCHGSVTGATGPHGASMTVNIAAGYTNDYSTGGVYLDSASPYIKSASGTPLCAKCHQASGFRSANNVHSRNNHNGSTNGQCINCHVKIPHAWKRPRLLGRRDVDPAPYAPLIVTGITERNYTPTGWQEQYCGVNGCGTHGASPTAPVWP